MGDRATFRQALRAIQLVAVLLTVQVLEAETVELGDLVVRTLPAMPSGTSHGYFGHAYSVTNRSTRPHRVELRVDSGSLAWGHYLLGLSQSVEVPAGTTVKVVLWQPPVSIYSTGVRIEVDGLARRERLPFSSDHPEVWTSSRGEVTRRILISQRIRESEFPVHDSEEEFQLLRADVAVGGWSDSWLGFSGYDGVVVHERDLVALSAAVAGALARYVEAGGVLLVAEAGPLAEAFLDTTDLMLFDRDRWASGPADPPGLRVEPAGLGVLLISSGALRSLGEDAWTRIRDEWKQTRHPWDFHAHPLIVRKQIPVVDKVEVPVRGLFLVILAFAVLIGPVNLVFLSRRKRRMWLLWTVPAAASLTCLVVVLFAFLGEGLVRRSRAFGMTVLDQRSHRAASFGWLGYYSTLTPGGLVFDRGTEVTPLLQLRSSGSTGSVEWSHRQRLTHGWVAARWPAYFTIRKAEVRRERLDLRSRDDGTLHATNGLGADLEVLWVADQAGRIYGQRRPIPAGAGVDLPITSAVAAARPAKQVRKLFGSALLADRLEVDRPETFLGPGTYFAAAAGSPFVEEALDGADSVAPRWWIFGWWEDVP